MKARLLLLATAAIAATACGNPNAVKATAVTIEDTLVVYSFHGAPVPHPTALNTFSHVAVRAEVGTNFDLVFDSARVLPGAVPDTQAVILPPKLILGVGITGILKSRIGYDSLVSAPGSGYQDSLPMVIRRGDVYVLQAHTANCGANVAPYNVLYTKIVIDSINPDPEILSIHFRMRVDPNCGFLSFRDGIPTG